MASSRRFYGIFILIIANIGFSSKAVIIKLLYRYEVDTMSVIALRMLFSLPFYIAALWWLARRREAPPLSMREAAAVGGLGILSYYVSSMLDFWGLQYVSAGVERLILFTYPTLVLLISAVWLKKPISRVQYIALILTYLGTALALVAERGLGEQANFMWGAALIFSCAFTYSLYVIGTGELVHRFGAVQFTSYAVLAATVPALAQSYWHNGMDIFGYPKAVYYLSVWMALIATVIPTFLIVEGIRLVGAANSSLIGFVGPIATIFLGYSFLGESITLLQLLGTAVVLVGIFLVVKK